MRRKAVDRKPAGRLKGEARRKLIAGYGAVKLRGSPTDLKRLRRETMQWVAEQALREL